MPLSSFTLCTHPSPDIHVYQLMTQQFRCPHCTTYLFPLGYDTTMSWSSSMPTTVPVVPRHYNKHATHQLLKLISGEIYKFNQPFAGAVAALVNNLTIHGRKQTKSFSLVTTKSRFRYVSYCATYVQGAIVYSAV